MKNKNDFFGILILSTLMIHLLLLNGRLLFWLVNLDNWNDIIENILTGIFAFSYSGATIYIISQKKIFNTIADLFIKLSFALLDGMAVFLWYNTLIDTDTKIQYTSSFYSVFTIAVTFGVGMVRMKQKQNSKLEIDLTAENEKLKNEISEISEKLKSLQTNFNNGLTDIDKLKSDQQIYLLGYLLYIKGRFNKAKTDPLRLEIANSYDELIEKYFKDLDIDSTAVKIHPNILQHFIK